MRMNRSAIGCLALCAGILIASSCTSHSFLRTKTEEVERPDGTKEKSTSSTSGRIDALNGEGVSGVGNAISGFFSDPFNAALTGVGGVSAVLLGVSRLASGWKNRKLDQELANAKAKADREWDQAYAAGVLAGRGSASTMLTPEAR